MGQIRQRGMNAPGNLVIPYSAHPAFDKAAHLMDVQVRRVPVGEDLLADVPAMANAIDRIISPMGTLRSS